MARHSTNQIKDLAMEHPMEAIVMIEEVEPLEHSEANENTTGENIMENERIENLVVETAEIAVVMSEEIEEVEASAAKATKGSWQTRMVWHPTLGLQPRYTYVDEHGRCVS